MKRDQSGAVAVVVGLLATVLLGMSAFVADFGMAYANKRQVQTAADAAVLGAAGVFAQQPGTSCATVVAAGSTAARAEATAKVGQNYTQTTPAALAGDYAVNCTAEGLVVSTSVTTTSPSFFGGLFGRSQYDILRSAAAVLDVPSTVVSGLRPFAICSKDLTPVGALPSIVVKLKGPGGGHRPEDCPDAGRSGNWWTIDCPGSNNGDLADNILYGCANPVSIVPTQPAPGNSTLPSYLTGYCGTTVGESCLGSNPGNVRSSGAESALMSLVASGKTVILPVFCGDPACVPAGLTDRGGNNTIYPVHKFIGVQVCGFHYGNRSSLASDMTGSCATANNPSNFRPTDGNNQDNYLLVVVKQVQVSGSTAPAGCRIGDLCDSGLRRTRLTEGPFTDR